ncbi:hypothetical protein Q3A80_18000 [Burkholderia sp. SR8]|jgi:hypothetical protein|uniref:hypothetical protein n=1 Tax=Burkholderia sp. SR8 TaxID=3062277 RepID=UPI00406449F3
MARSHRQAGVAGLHGRQGVGAIPGVRCSDHWPIKARMIAGAGIDASGIVGRYFDFRHIASLYSSNLYFLDDGGTLSFSADFFVVAIRFGARISLLSGASRSAGGWSLKNIFKSPNGAVRFGKAFIRPGKHFY